MLKVKHLFKTQFIALLFFSFAFPSSGFAEKNGDFKINHEGFYKEVFHHGIFYEGTSYLHLERAYRKITGSKRRSVNANVYDEVPDSHFFINRHAKSRLTEQELSEGYRENSGPDFSGNVTITKGKFDGLHPGFFVKDGRGDGYLIKFDPIDFFEMSTAAEVVTSRFYHAIGYNVPQYTVETIKPDSFTIEPGAMTYDDSGFKKELTRDMLEEYLLFIPRDENGNFRVSASKLLPGDYKGYFSFHGRRSRNPDDPVDHRLRREIRALQVFASWLNNYDQRDGNTLDMLVTEDGKTFLKHYLIDFNGSLGSGTAEAKPPMFSYEHMFDYGETTKAFFTLGFWEKPWQERQRELGDRLIYSTAVGSFTNEYFDPAGFKMQLPNYAAKDLTLADAFWASKILMSFTDDDIRAMVKSGKYSLSSDEEYLADVLIERRDIIARYWFEKTNPLDQFDKKDNKLIFKDLAVEYGFEKAGEATYHVDLVGKKGNKKKKITSIETASPSVELKNEWFENFDRIDFNIRTMRQSKSKMSEPVFVSLDSNGVGSIRHID